MAFLELEPMHCFELEPMDKAPKTLRPDKPLGNRSIQLPQFFALEACGELSFRGQKGPELRGDEDRCIKCLKAKA